MHIGTDRRIVLLGRLTGYGVGYRGPGGHNQGPAGAGQNRSERFDHTAIVLTVRHEFREVMVEGQVDNAVACAAPFLRQSSSSIDPRYTSAPVAARAAALSFERQSPST